MCSESRNNPRPDKPPTAPAPKGKRRSIARPPFSNGAGSQVVAGTFWLLLSDALMLPTGFFSAVFLSRTLGPASYGLFALVSRLILWIEWGSIAGFSDTTIKFVSESKDWKPVAATIVRLHLAIGIGFGILVWAASVFLATLFQEPGLSTYLKLFAFEIPLFSLLFANISILIGRGLFKAKAAVTAARWMLRLGLIVLLVTMGFSVKGAILGSIGAILTALLISFFHVPPTVALARGIPFGPLFGFSLPLYFSNLNLRVFRLDLFALKMLGGTAAQAGFYGAALNLSMPPNLLTAALSSPLLATISHLLGSGKAPEAKNIAATALRSTFWIAPLAVMTASASSEIIRFVFGPDYLPAAPILAYLIFGTVGTNALYISRAILTALGKPAWVLLLTSPMVPLALAGHIFLIPRLEGVGAALVTAVVACSGGLASIVAIRRLWGILPLLRSVINGLICSILAYALAVFWPVSGAMVIVKLAGISLLVVAAFFALGEFSSEEIRFIRKFLPFGKALESRHGQNDF